MKFILGLSVGLFAVSSLGAVPLPRCEFGPSLFIWLFTIWDTNISSIALNPDDSE